MRVEGVAKTYREGGIDTCVLREVTFELVRGGTTSLVGTSGSGKTTILSLIAGLMQPDEGQIVFDGQAFGDLDDAERARLRGARIGVVLQSGNLIPFLTAHENVELALGLGGRDQNGHRADEILDELGLADRVDHLPRRLSGGEMQRVSIAMALATEPELLLADEVTGELDSSTANQVLKTIFDLSHRRGLTTLYVTHDDELARRAEQRLRLADGEVGPA